MIPSEASANAKKDDEYRKGVCFDSNLDIIIDVDSHLDYTADERSSAWYTPAECRIFKVQDTRESLQSNTTRSMDFARSQRIDDVRDLLLKAQDVQRKRSCRNYDMVHTTDKIIHRNNVAIGNSGNAQWGSYSRWLADFYKHHSEACKIDARTRALENSSTVNDCWFVKGLNHPRLSRRSVPDKGTISKCSPSKRFSITTISRSYEDLSTLANEEQQHPKKEWKLERWSPHGPSYSPLGEKSTLGTSSKDLPLKPLRHITTPPLLYRKCCDNPVSDSKRRNEDWNVPRKPRRQNSKQDGEPAYNSNGRNVGGDTPPKPLRHMATSPASHYPHAA